MSHVQPRATTAAAVCYKEQAMAADTDAGEWQSFATALTLQLAAAALSLLALVGAVVLMLVLGPGGAALALVIVGKGAAVAAVALLMRGPRQLQGLAGVALALALVSFVADAAVTSTVAAWSAIAVASLAGSAAAVALARLFERAAWALGRAGLAASARALQALIVALGAGRAVEIFARDTPLPDANGIGGPLAFFALFVAATWLHVVVSLRAAARAAALTASR
jgi:hypothetical protein